MADLKSTPRKNSHFFWKNDTVLYKSRVERIWCGTNFKVRSSTCVNMEKSTVKLLSFDGKEQNVTNWWVKFRAFARYQGFNEVISESRPVGLAEDEDDPMHEDSANYPDSVRLFKQNSLAVASLTSAFTNENHICMGFVQDSMTKSWPNGATWVILKRLLRRYKPNDLMTEIELNRILSELKLGADENPGNLFTQIAAIRTWYSKDIGEEKILPALMVALPKDYGTLTSMYGLNKSIGAADTLEDLEEALVALWRSMGGKASTAGKDLSAELGLAGLDGITCYFCKEKGHKANNCPKKSGGKTKAKFEGNCNLCGRKGHMKADCFEDEKNADKRPKNWKSKMANDGRSETQTALVDSMGVLNCNFIVLSAPVMRIWTYWLNPPAEFRVEMRIGMNLP